MTCIYRGQRRPFFLASILILPHILYILVFLRTSTNIEERDAEGERFGRGRGICVGSRRRKLKRKQKKNVSKVTIWSTSYFCSFLFRFPYPPCLPMVKLRTITLRPLYTWRHRVKLLRNWLHPYHPSHLFRM